MKHYRREMNIFGSLIDFDYFNEQNNGRKIFFRYKVLQMSSTINDIGKMRWELVACGVLLWIAVYFCIWKGVKSAGKVSFEIEKYHCSGRE